MKVHDGADGFTMMVEVLPEGVNNIVKPANVVQGPRCFAEAPQ